MRFKNLLIALLFASFGAASYAQLPDSFNQWETRSFRPITASTAAQFSNNDAPVVLEYGLVSGEHREYANRDQTLSVNLWRMKDASGGFGLYTFYRDIGTASMDQPDRIAVWPDRLLVQHGPFVLDARGAKLTVADAKLLLAKLRLQKDDTLVPELPTFLPQDNLVAQSPKFVMGPVALDRLNRDKAKALPAASIGFSEGAEAAIAEYRLSGGKVHFLLVSYATPQLAAKKLRAFQQLPAIAAAKDGDGIYVSRKGSLVAFVLDAPSAAVADGLLHSIHYQSEITWNQYVPTRRDNIGDLVLSVFLLAGFILLFSLVAGLSFGGLRVLTKKFLPMPIFDRPSQMEIIQLHLTDD